MNIFCRLFGIAFLFTCLCALEAKNRPHCFPEECCYLHELQDEAKSLRKEDCKKSKALIYEINQRVKEDPKILLLTSKKTKMHKKNAGRHHHPFDKNRLGKHIEGLYINASDVHMKRQNFVLSSCPRTLSEVRDYFDATLERNVEVFVSAITSTEAKRRSNNFWKNDRLKKITLRDGSKIAHVSSKVLQIHELKKLKKTIPQIIESCLYTSAGKKITHLHYEGWRDQSAMPCEKLLGLLLDRICELSPDPEVPIAINCKGGVGRTGTVAVSLYLRRIVDAQLKAGIELDAIRVNIPEVVYSFRYHRRSIVGVPEQLVQIYTVLADYYERLKEG